MINLKRSFRKILREYGHDVLLQRRISNEFEYSKELERFTTRYFYPRTSSLMYAQQQNLEGFLSNTDLVYYFEEEVMPKKGDRIYEDFGNGTENAQIYLVDTAIPMRGRLGQVIYWAVGVSRESPA